MQETVVSVRLIENSTECSQMSKFKNQELDRQPCLTLYKAMNGIRRFYSELLNQYNVTYPQYLVLSVLWERDGIPLKEIMNRLNLDSGTLSPLMKRIQGAGFVVKSRCPNDDRVVLIQLTEKGKNLRPLLSDVHQRVANQADLTSAEYHMLIDMLDTVARKLSLENVE